jgi:hypothetical protein
MKVFLAGIMQGSKVEAAIHGQDWREPIKAALAKHAPSAEVYCHYSQHPNSIGYGREDIRRTLAEGNRLAGASDVLIAFCPSASMGTAIEMYEAARGGALILAISPMAANWVIRSYSDRLFADMESFERFLAETNLDEMLATKRAGGLQPDPAL